MCLNVILTLGSNMTLDQIHFATRLVETWNEGLTTRFLLNYPREANFSFRAKWSIISENRISVETKREKRLISYIA